MENKKQPDCIIEQYTAAPNVKFFLIERNTNNYKASWDVVSITKVYLKPEYKKQLQNDFQYSY